MALRRCAKFADSLQDTHTHTHAHAYAHAHTPVAYLNVIDLKGLTVLKKVDGELQFIAVSSATHHLPLPLPPQYDKRTGGLELGLHPVFSIDIIVGHIDTKAAVLTENDKCCAVMSGLCGSKREQWTLVTVLHLNSSMHKLTASEEGGCLMATIPCTLALLGRAFNSCTCIWSGFTNITTGLLVF